MFNLKSVRGQARARASMAAIVGMGALMAYLSPVSAGEAASASDTESDDAVLEEVQVTGSRIRRTTDYTTAVPTTVIDVTTMENAGIVNIGDVLALTPSNVSAFTPATTGMSSFNTGAYVPDLRGLNPFFGSRTLTLIDGQRPVATSTIDSFDLNLIPTALVQRIDSVTGGGSASYGSGAVAGAINIILNHQLEGGKFDIDTSAAIPENDARSNHIGFAYGHGLFEGRAHFVIGAEYQKQDAARCNVSSRGWCSDNRGPYQTSTISSSGFGTSSTAIQSVGYGLTQNVNPYGVLAPAIFNTSTFSGYTLTTRDFFSSNPTGTGQQAFNPNSSIYLANAPGGDGTLVNQYTNLITSVKRKLVTGLFSADITDNIKTTLDLSWGKVNALNPQSNFQINTGTILGFDNPYLQTVTGQNATQLRTAANQSAVAAGALDSPGYTLAKDFNAQIPDVQFNDTTVKQAQLGVLGTIPNTSWTWDAHAIYGKTDNVQGSNHEPTVLQFSMALDATAAGCRVSQGGLPAAYTSAQGGYNNGGVGAGFFGIGVGTGLPLWARVFDSVRNGIDVVSPVTGLTESQTLALFASRCQPLNPFGTAALPANAANYATGPLSLALQQESTAFNLNTSGEFFDGLGAGPFSVAVGYDFRRQKTQNDFRSCPGARNTLGNANLTPEQRECLGIATDFAYQFGNDYGGSSTFNEVYAEVNLPLLKDAPGAKLLGLNLAGRETWYNNTADYGVNIVPGTKNTGSLATWKAALVYEPLEGIRFRGSQSHDSRAPNPRDLYYSQTFVPGGPFGGFCFSGNFQRSSPVCFVNLVGNVDLKPETSNTTALGLVFTPTQLRGFEASVDWFSVKLKDAIQGGGLAGLFRCAGGGACDTVTFNNYYYNPTAPAPGAPRGSSPTAVPGWVTGEAAYRLGDVTNIIQDNEPAYNGGISKASGVDFSVSYSADLGASKLSVRALTTLVTKQLVQNDKGGVVTDARNAIGSTPFLANFQSAAKLRGNVFVTWTRGELNITPNMSWIAPGKISNTALSCDAADFAASDTLCNWLANGYYGGPNQTPAQLEASQKGYTLLPTGEDNRIGSYFLFGLNASYNLKNIPGLKGLQVWGQINNLMDRDPPFVETTTTAAAFYDQLGRTYRMGVRLSF
jgi:outer membrane receptor protein involved in Fe transport